MSQHTRETDIWRVQSWRQFHAPVDDVVNCLSPPDSAVTLSPEATASTADSIHTCSTHNVHSFVCSIRGGGKLLAVFRRSFSHRLRWGLGLAQCASSLTLGLVVYIYRVPLSRLVSLAMCQSVASYRTASTFHLLSMPAALTHPDAPNPGVMACHILRGHSKSTLYLPENLIS